MNIKRLIIYGLIPVALLLVVFAIRSVMDNALDDLQDAAHEQFKVCLGCGHYEVKDSAMCEECNSTSFAINWCDGCESVFENDSDYAFCPNCGRKQ